MVARTASEVRGRRRFALALFGIALVGFAVRLAYGLAADLPNGIGDDLWYHDLANGLTGGRGFSDPFVSLGPDGGRELGAYGEPIPTAFHAPLFPGLLAAASEIGASSYRAHQVVAWTLGAGTVAVIGLIGRRLGGERLGLIAALCAAVYLPLAINDSFVMSESLYGLLVAFTILAALRLGERPSGARAFVLGAALGLAALTRTEALLLSVLLVPVIWRAGGQRARNVALVAAGVALLVVPWCVRNSLVFDQPVGIVTGAGSVAAGANTDSTYHGRLLGAWDPLGPFRRPGGRTPGGDEPEQSAHWRAEAARYARDHLGRVPVVVAARVGRTWSLYPLAPAEKARFASDYYRRIRAVEYLVLVAFVVALCFAAIGLRAIRGGRPAAPLWLFVAPVVLVTVVSATGYGDLRFRQAADVSIAILAAVGVARTLDAWRPRAV